LTKQKIKLNGADFVWSGESSRESGRAKARQPRALDLSSYSFAVTHLPTKLSVKGELPKGHYSRRDIAEFRERLLAQLVEAVLKASKLP